jgi:ADP-ribose pyrophosphatase YjhB (NUDIX family)
MAERVYTQTFGVVGAIIEENGKILLVQEIKGGDKGKWNQPAGWIDVGEDPLEALKREVKEETGLDFEPTNFLGVYSLYRRDLIKTEGIARHAIKLIFCGKVLGGKLTVKKDEIAGLRWFTLEEIENMTLDKLRDLDIKQEVRDYFAGRLYPLEIVQHTVSK